MAGSRRTAWKECWELSGRPPSPARQAEAPRRAATAGRAAAGRQPGPRRSPQHRSAESRWVPSVLVIPGPAGPHKPPTSLAGPRNPRSYASPQSPAQRIPADPHSSRHPRPAASPRSRPGGSRREPATPGPAYHGAGVRVETAGAPLGQRLRRHHLDGESGRGRLRLHAPGERGAPYINRLKTINKNFLVAI